MCVPNETNNANVKVYNMVTRMNEVKTLVKHISYDCKCKFASRTFNSNQKWNTVLIDKCQSECKKYCTCKKGYGWK